MIGKKETVKTFNNNFLDSASTRRLLIGVLLFLLGTIALLEKNGVIGTIVAYIPVFLFGAFYIVLALLTMSYGVYVVVKPKGTQSKIGISKLTLLGLFLFILMAMSEDNLTLATTWEQYRLTFLTINQFGASSVVASGVNGGIIGWTLFALLNSLLGKIGTQLLYIIGIGGCGFLVLRPLLYFTGTTMLNKSKNKEKIRHKKTKEIEDDLGYEVEMSLEDRLARIKVEDHNLRNAKSMNRLFVREEEMKPSAPYVESVKSFNFMPAARTKNEETTTSTQGFVIDESKNEAFNVFTDSVFKTNHGSKKEIREKRVGRDKIFFDFTGKSDRKAEQAANFEPRYFEPKRNEEPVVERFEMPVQQAAEIPKGIQRPAMFDEPFEEKPAKIDVVQVNEHRIERKVAMPKVQTTKKETSYRYPTFDLLKQESINRTASARAEADYRGELLDQKLKIFGIDAWVKNYIIAPAFTRFEVELGQQAKMHQFNTIKNDLMGALSAERINILTPIPGSQYVGIEIPNKERSTVSFKEVFSEIPFELREQKLLVILGKNITDNVITTELNKAPHMLIAGQTGSGKSVCINSIIISLLMRCHPDEVKLLLIDPKRVELAVYGQIPHLICPVISDPKKAAVALSHLVDEISDRYKVLETSGFKNIESFNEYARENDGKPFPYIVTIIDELADLMLVATKSVEESIRRITAIARAAGIHLIVATQRPSVDVITGTIKANIPTRIAFAVSSGVDSRTIVDEVGAEELLGNGDMLFRHPSFRVLERIQGAFVSDADIEAIVSFVKKQAQPNYVERFLNLDPVQEQLSLQDSLGYSSENEDIYYQDILNQLSSWEAVSASYLQRKFSIGYQRASRIIDRLENEGFVGPVNGSKPREIYREKIEEYLENEK